MVAGSRGGGGVRVGCAACLSGKEKLASSREEHVVRWPHDVNVCRKLNMSDTFLHPRKSCGKHAG